MGYGYESKSPIFGTPMLGAENCFIGTKNNGIGVQVLNPCTLTGVGILLGNNTATDNVVITVTRRLLANNTTNNVVVGNFTVGPYNATARGQIWYAGNNFAPQDANAGDELWFAAANNGGSFTWIPWIDAVARAETKLNNNDFVAANNTSA